MIEEEKLKERGKKSKGNHPSCLRDNGLSFFKEITSRCCIPKEEAALHAGKAQSGVMVQYII